MSNFKSAVFVSYPQPHLSTQKDFVQRIFDHLSSRGLAARTLGVTDYDYQAPLHAIRRLMLESNGLIAIALRRSYSANTVICPGGDMPGRIERTDTNVWSTSTWSHVEPAMAYQLGLPVLLLRERGVTADGMFGLGVMPGYTPEFDLDADGGRNFLQSEEFNQVLHAWEGDVRAVVREKGKPPALY